MLIQLQILPQSARVFERSVDSAGAHAGHERALLGVLLFLGVPDLWVLPEERDLTRPG
jgi:hypothetical protein